MLLTPKFGHNSVIVRARDKNERNVIRTEIHRSAKEEGLRVRSECISPTRVRVFASKETLNKRVPRWLP